MMEKATISSIKVAGLAILSLLAGCGDSGKPHSVSGVVLMEGQPIHGANVTFHPIEGQAVRPAVGTSDAAGKFSLSTFRADDGALRGKYKVTIEWFGPPPEGGEKTFADFIKENKKAKKPAPTPPVRSSAVPAAYTAPATTPFEVSVPTGRVKLGMNRHGTKDE